MGEIYGDDWWESRFLTESEGRNLGAGIELKGFVRHRVPNYESRKFQWQMLRVQFVSSFSDSRRTLRKFEFLRTILEYFLKAEGGKNGAKCFQPHGIHASLAYIYTCREIINSFQKILY